MSERETIEKPWEAPKVSFTVEVGRPFKVVVQGQLKLKDVAEVYAKLHTDESPLVARRWLLSLDLLELEGLARRGVKLEGEGDQLSRSVLDPDNDPDLLDPLVILLWGMNNDRVRYTQDFLIKQDYEDCPTHGVLDDRTLELHQDYLQGLGGAK